MTYPEFIEEWENKNDFIVAHTSGSTGNPKLIHLPKDFVKESALRTVNFFHLSGDSRLHSCISPEFIGGKMMAVRANFINAAFSWETPSNCPLKDLPKESAFDLVSVVPSQMIFILENLNNLPKVSNFLVGGAPLNDTLRKKIVESKLNVYESYGMTETASHIALRKVTYPQIPFSVLPEISIETDERNCLKIIFRNGKTIQTNDISEIISPDKFYIKGRIDNIINSGGKKINPLDLEKKISSHLSESFFITSFPDEKWGEKIVMIAEETERTLNKEKLKEIFDKTLQKWERPKEIYLVKKLPLTLNGKIFRFKDPSFLPASSLCIDLFS